MKCLAAYFYANEKLLMSTRAARLQGVFDVLMDLFDRVGLRTNVGKIVNMVFHPCHDIGGHSIEAYEF